jgi:hypothetical protein
MKTRILPPEYTAVPNPILDNLAIFSHGQLCVLMVISRNTFGWNKAEKALPITAFEAATGLSRPTIISALQSLVDDGWVSRTLDGQTGVYSLIVGDQEKPETDAEENGGVSKNLIPPDRLNNLTSTGKVFLPVEGSPNIELKKGKKLRVQFSPPSLDEVIEVGCKIGLPESECKKFHAYHEMRGWTMGKNGTAKMKSWRAALNYWKQIWKENGGAKRRSVEG